MVIATMAHSSTVSTKGQITLPKPLRDRHHLKAGEIVLILDSEEGIVIRHGRHSLRGMLKGDLDSSGFERDLKKLRREWTL
jgi:AbrB family looped-hinge helix DNA binding protein